MAKLLTFLSLLTILMIMVLPLPCWLWLLFSFLLMLSYASDVLLSFDVDFVDVIAV